ncbi:MAG: hypothetical protein ABR562_00290 [Thermoplasmatota archaeon]|nr:hypothetical protein [Halobacteriales archaeon]
MAWLRTLALWLAFLTFVVGGAALLISTSTVGQGIGLALLLAPVAFLGYLTLAHYARERRQARP